MHSKVVALPGLALWLLLAAGYALYLPGQHGMFNFDDSVNLKGLADVRDGWTALVFMVTGEASALSRPVALASFLLNLNDWPKNPQGFLYINILIHLLNGALLAWMVLRLVRLAQPNLKHTEWIAVSTTALWLLSPLLTSTSLIIIQRMTSLCGTFVLTGLLVYLVGLSWETSGRIKLGRWLQTGSIVLGTLLAVLAKENGALLSLYALILEITVLTGVAELRAWRRWRMGLLVAPPLLLLTYIALKWPSMMAVYATRDFTLGERLMTEAVILWDYLRLALLPRPVAFSPFHDDYPIIRNLFEQPWALIAMLSWLAILALAIRQRRCWPLFALAVLWYLGGHTLESTVLPLELYFEHRNYLPLMGPALALIWWVWTLHSSWRRLALAALGSYTLLIAAMLWQLTTLWGQPRIAAELWSIHHPASPRATHFLATNYLAIDDPGTARRVLEKAAYADPETIGLSFQALILTCKNRKLDKTQVLYQMALKHAAQGEYSAATVNSLERLQAMLQKDECPGLDRPDLHKIADLLMTNPVYTISPRRLGHLHFFKSQLYREDRNLDGTLRHLEASYGAEPDIGVAALTVGTMLSADLRDEARAFLDQTQKDLPLNPILRAEWLRIIDQLRDVVDRSRPR